MSEPIKLYKPGGETVNVYGENQARAMLDSGQWFATQADADAGTVRAEPTPATAAKLAALEGEAVMTQGGAALAQPAPEPPAAPPARKPAKGKDA